MSELTDITANFHKASNALSPISSKPNDGKLQRINKVIVVCCLSVTLTRKVAGSPSGVVLPDSVYKAKYGGLSFNFMRDVYVEYDPVIKNLSRYDRVSMMRGLEHSWAVGTANQSRIRAIEVGARNLILDNVEPTWVTELSVPGTFYTSVRVCAILDHLKKDGTGLDWPTGVELILGLHKLWEADLRIIQFIINMEEVQKKSVRV